MQIIKPYTSNNAVKVVAFAINFSSEFTQQEMNSLIDVLTNYFKDSFDKIEKAQEVSVTIHADGTQRHEQAIGGIILESTKNESLNFGWGLTVNKNVLLLTCKVYSRWNDIVSKAMDIIDKVFDKITVQKEIGRITLEYLDEFEIVNAKMDWKKSLFKEDCQYIMPHIYNLNDFWHINHGYFVKLDDLKYKLLDTLNINYFIDEQDNLKEKINILAQHVLFEMNEFYSKENIEANLNIMHIHSKRIFEEIISNEILSIFDKGISE